MKRVLSTGDIANAGLGEDDNDRSSTQARGRRNKRTKKGVNHGQSVPSTQPNAIVDDDNISTTPSLLSEVSRLQKSVDQLSTIVHNQKLTISSLSNQLKFVLSFLGITDGELASVSHEAVAHADNRDSVGHSTDIAAQAGAGAVIADGATLMMPYQVNVLCQVSVHLSGECSVSLRHSAHCPHSRLNRCHL